MPMGVLATGSAHATHSAWHPLDMGEDVLAHVSGGEGHLDDLQQQRHLHVEVVLAR